MKKLFLIIGVLLAALLFLEGLLRVWKPPIFDQPSPAGLFVEDAALGYRLAKSFQGDFIRSFSQPMESVSLRRPSLDDVFLHLTGHDIEAAEAIADVDAGVAS